MKMDFLNSKETCSIGELSDKDNLWHRRLGHLGKGSLNQLGLPLICRTCSACVERRKAMRLPFHKKLKTTKGVDTFRPLWTS